MNTTATTTSTGRKLLIPLATMAVAGAVAVGSGATWNTKTESDISITGGDLLHSNNRNGVTLDLNALKPGDIMTGTLTITNTGDVASYLKVTETDSSNYFGLDEATVADATDRDLKLTITASGMTDPLYDGDFGAWVNGTSRDVMVGATESTTKATLDAPAGETPGDAVTLTFAVELIDTADNDSQAAIASAAYDFVTVPVEGETTGLTGVWETVTGSTDSTDGTP